MLFGARFCSCQINSMVACEQTHLSLQKNKTLSLVFGVTIKPLLVHTEHTNDDLVVMCLTLDCYKVLPH